MKNLMTTAADIDGLSEKTWAGGRFVAPFMNYHGAPQIAWDKPNEGEGGSGADDGNDGNDGGNENNNGGADTDDGDDSDDDGDATNDAGDDIAALKAQNARLIKDVMKKKAALKDATKSASEAAAALAAYKGVDPAKVEQLVQAAAAAEAAEAEARGDFEAVKAMMVEEHKNQTDTLQAQIDALTQARAQDAARIADLTIGNSFSSSKYIQSELLLSPNKARKLYGAHFEVTDDGIVAYNKPAGEANRAPFVDASGVPLQFDEALKRLIDADPDRDTMLRVKMKPGGGSGTETNKTSSDGNKPKTELYGVSRIAASLGDFTSKKS